MGLLLVSKAVLLSALGIGLVLNETLIVEVGERGVKHYEGRGLETLLIAVAEADIFQCIQFLSITGDHHRKEKLVVFCLLTAVFHFVEERVFVGLRGIKLETVRTCHVSQITVKVLASGGAEVDNLCRCLKLGQHQLLLNLLDFFRRKGRKLDGVHSTRCTLNDAVVVEPSQDVVHLVFNGSA